MDALFEIKFNIKALKVKIFERVFSAKPKISICSILMKISTFEHLMSIIYYLVTNTAIFSFFLNSVLINKANSKYFSRLDAAIAAAEDEVDLAIVDIDDLADIAMEHGVNAVPTVIGLKNGEVVDKFVGLVDEDKLSSFIAKLRVN